MTKDAEMAIAQFIQRVAAMRLAQSRYFKNQTGSNLTEAKKSEAAVDRSLGQLGGLGYDTTGTEKKPDSTQNRFF